MWEYLIQDIVHVITPYLGASVAVISGIVISNMFWKARIHRFAKTEIVETLEYQSNKIAQLEDELREKKEIISDLKGFNKRAKINAMKILEG